MRRTDERVRGSTTEQRASRERGTTESLPEERGTRGGGEGAPDGPRIDRRRGEAGEVRGLLDDGAGARREVGGRGERGEALARAPSHVLEHSARALEPCHGERAVGLAHRGRDDAEPALVLAARVGDETAHLGGSCPARVAELPFGFLERAGVPRQTSKQRTCAVRSAHGRHATRRTRGAGDVPAATCELGAEQRELALIIDACCAQCREGASDLSAPEEGMPEIEDERCRRAALGDGILGRGERVGPRARHEQLTSEREPAIGERLALRDGTVRIAVRRLCTGDVVERPGLRRRRDREREEPVGELALGPFGEPPRRRSRTDERNEPARDAERVERLDRDLLQRLAVGREPVGKGDRLLEPRARLARDGRRDHGARAKVVGAHGEIGATNARASRGDRLARIGGEAEEARRACREPGCGRSCPGGVGEQSRNPSVEGSREVRARNRGHGIARLRDRRYEHLREHEPERIEIRSGRRGLATPHLGSEVSHGAARCPLPCHACGEPHVDERRAARFGVVTRGPRLADEHVRGLHVPVPHADRVQLVEAAPDAVSDDRGELSSLTLLRAELLAVDPVGRDESRAASEPRGALRHAPSIEQRGPPAPLQPGEDGRLAPDPPVVLLRDLERRDDAFPLGPPDRRGRPFARNLDQPPRERRGGGRQLRCRPLLVAPHFLYRSGSAALVNLVGSSCT